MPASLSVQLEISPVSPPPQRLACSQRVLLLCLLPVPQTFNILRVPISDVQGDGVQGGQSQLSMCLRNPKGSRAGLF